MSVVKVSETVLSAARYITHVQCTITLRNRSLLYETVSSACGQGMQNAWDSFRLAYAVDVATAGVHNM